MSNNELFNKIEKVLEKAPENRHSYYQLKYFVLGKEPTTQSQLWQCLRELQSRKETIDAMQVQIEDSKDELELIAIEMEKMEEPPQIDLKFYNKEKEIKLRRLKRKQESILSNINSMEKKLQYVIQEARFFLQAFESLEKIEPLKDYDDYESQKEFWEAKLTEEINLRMMTKQPLPAELLKTVLSLHEDSKIKENIVTLIGNNINKIQMVLSKETDGRKQVDDK